MKEFISFSEVNDAYFDCRTHKRHKDEPMRYEMNYEKNNYELWKDLNEDSYEIGISICFCVRYPKVREVFAASFRDRIVHHIIINKMLCMFEDSFIDDTYSCRKGKGVLYGVERIREQVASIGINDCWYVKLDLSGFFMSINKDILWRDISELMDLNEPKFNGNLDRWKSLVHQIIYNRCELNCEKRGDFSLWDILPPEKSLFNSDGRGIPIGNLTSQIFANFYLTPLDKFISSRVEGYGRYVDDFILLDRDKNKLLKLIPEIRKLLSSYGLRLNERKTIIQKCNKGIQFTGYIIKPWGVYVGNRLEDASMNLLLEYGVNDVYDIDKIICRMNSYLGFMRNNKLTYRIRNKITSKLENRYPGSVYTREKESIHKRIIKSMDTTLLLDKNRKVNLISKVGVDKYIIRWIVYETKYEYCLKEIQYRGDLNSNILKSVIYDSIDRYIDEMISNFTYNGFPIKLDNLFLSNLSLVLYLGGNINLEVPYIGVDNKLYTYTIDNKDDLISFSQVVNSYIQGCMKLRNELKKKINIQNYEDKIKKPDSP